MIALDLDGVVANLTPVVMRRLVERLGLEPADVRYWDPEHYDDVLAEFPERVRTPEAERILSEIYGDPETYREAHPMPHALEAAQWLARRKLLTAYITRRKPHTRDVTLEWLRERGFPMRPVHHVERPETKAEVAARLGVSILVEDSPREAREFAEAGLTPILIEHRYNRSLTEPWVLRAGSWEALRGLLERLPLDYRERRDPLGYGNKRGQHGRNA